MDVEIVIPVDNRQDVLEDSVRRLHAFLSAEFPFSWRITIADSASLDATPAIARALTEELTGVEHLRLEATGRGAALAAAWSASRARVACYVDVDLSTDLKGLLSLIAPLLSGHSELAIGSRLVHGAHVSRGARSEFISRAYNLLLHVALRARFSDAQCAFKAVRSDVLSPLLVDVRDAGPFFDTELLVLAQRRGLRIHEVPVDWVDNRDSRVDISATALAGLRGVVRMAFALPLLRFMTIGVISTIAYALLYLGLQVPLGPVPANTLALALTAVANTAANRRLTFGVHGQERLLRQHAAAAVVFVLALGITNGALAALHAVDPRASAELQTGVLIVASAGATVARYIALHAWVFAHAGIARPGLGAHSQAAAGPRNSAVNASEVFTSENIG